MFKDTLNLLDSNRVIYVFVSASFYYDWSSSISHYISEFSSLDNKRALTTLTLFDYSVILRDEEGLLAIVGLVGLVLRLEFLVDVGTEFLEKHLLEDM